MAEEKQVETPKIARDAGEISPGHHHAEAHNWAEAADREAANGMQGQAQTFAAVAQAHASLAIAEQLGRLNDQLEMGAIEVMYGGRTV